MRLGEMLTNFDNEIVKRYLPLLLKDMSTGKDFDFDYEKDFKPGYERSRVEFNLSSKKRAAIYTPPFLVRRMNLFLEYENKEKLYNGTLIEAACGEAPFIVQRYNMITGEKIAIEDREGILDIKIKYGIQNIAFGWAWGTAPYSNWYPDVKRMFQTVFGFDKHLPSLIIARMNLLLSFIEYSREYYAKRRYFKTHELPPEEHIKEIAEIICWNFWCMDFLNVKNEVVRDWETGEISKFKDLLKKQMEVKLLTTPEQFSAMEYNAAYAMLICHANTEKLQSEKPREFLKRAMKAGHESVLEHITLTYEVNNLSRACLQELARHRHISLSVESTRHTLKKIFTDDNKLIQQAQNIEKNTMLSLSLISLNGFIKSVLPEFKEIDTENKKGFIRLDIALLAILRYMSTNGKAVQQDGSLNENSSVSNDLLKYYLPEFWPTNLILTANIRALRELIKKRTNPAALKEFQVLARKFVEAVPDEFKYLLEDCVHE